MTDTEFAEIPNKAVPRTVRLIDPSLESPRATSWILIGYCAKLLHKNEQLQQMLRRVAGRLDDPECRQCMTPGQRILYSLTALDGQVNNGGITQFFWNCPGLVFEASESLESLGDVVLARAYNRALEALAGRQENWLDLRRQSNTDPGKFWEAFKTSYDLLNLDWFDDEYFKSYSQSLVSRLVQYVRSHKSEFIES